MKFMTLRKKINGVKTNIGCFMARKKAGDHQYVGAALLLILVIAVAVAYKTGIMDIIGKFITEAGKRVTDAWNTTN